MTLDDVCTELELTVKDFKEQWLKKHAEDPEMYPLELPPQNAGLWTEFFINFYTNNEL